MSYKKTWGRSKLYYCPKSEVVWQTNKNGDNIIHYDMPSYGLERKNIGENK